jgi:hypothetical protein
MEKNLFSSDFQPDFPVFTIDVRRHESGLGSEKHATSFPPHILIPLISSHFYEAKKKRENTLSEDGVYLPVCDVVSPANPFVKFL